MIEYKELDFPGYSNYKVGTDGSVWSRNRTLFSQEQLEQIKKEYCTGSTSYQKLGKKYQVTNTTIWKLLNKNINCDWKQLKLVKGGGGYLCVRLSNNGNTKGYSVHKLVLLAFMGQPQLNMECRYLDGNKFNNNIDNLKCGTRSENAQDQIRHGTKARYNAIRRKK